MFKHVGRALSALRELRGMSQAALARKAGIGKSQLSKYENCKEYPKLDSLEKLLRALGGRPLMLFYLVEALDRTATEAPMEALLVGAGFEPVLTASEEVSYGKVMTELLALFKAQIEGRVRVADVSKDKRAPRA
jgi:transcriptional regulator with XRE-family HTH domain